MLLVSKMKDILLRSCFITCLGFKMAMRSGAKALSFTVLFGTTKVVP